MPMYWYDAGTWKKTEKLSVWDTAWKDVRTCWIWDGSWKVCYTSPASLDTFDALDDGGGQMTFSWSYTADNASDWTIYLDYSSNSGTSWVQIAGYTITDTPKTVVSLSNTYWYRCRMVFTQDLGIQADNSPLVITPPYPT